MRVLIINLEQSIDRLNQQTKQFYRLGMSFERLPAVSAHDISQQFYLNNLKYAQRVLKQTEMACFLSHKKAWEKVVADNEPYVILEDDAVLSCDFKKILNEIDGGHLHECELINLEVQPRNKIIKKTPIKSLMNGEYRLYPLLLEKNGTGGYILFPSGAKKLLHHAKKKLLLADDFIYHCPNLHKYQIEPAILLQDVICPAYGIPINNPPKSIILSSNHTLDYSPTSLQKIRFRKNRIFTQIKLAITTLYFLMIGQKRQIMVDTTKFLNGEN